ncbi:hypothetical protein THASP1DRAFT_23860 [Thamnocephalis sphaerospora]|uniref:Cortical protein marker for cell polarity-domain-containing protein n=1 Tax=Thamnocephalis sphaerospora TaxID=78915 RepID=A0A4P9XRF5_9FUNG|nr:hypothetical protein THASP1DRAFT_23860 [Thamnocephalis sphaerospora]|eukprot:RKP08091.1 hypothetical protein THASP1DRAFT_23860 [Thamnocephalis sphaerospora]
MLRSAMLLVLGVVALWLPCVVYAALPQLQWINYDSFVTGDRPPPRYDFAMGYDARRKFVYIFGGRTATGQLLDDTWILDVSAFTWRRPNPTITVRPPGRYAAVSGMDQPGDQSRDSFIVALGSGQAGALDDVWSLDLNNEQWFRVNVTGTGPGAVAGAVGGIDVRNKDPVQSLVVAGGVAADNGGGIDGTSSVKGTMDAIYAMTLSGNWVRNEFFGAWHRMALASGSQLPPLRRNVGSAVSGNSRLTIFGGCTSTALVDCPIQDASILSFPDQNTEVAKRGAPSWGGADQCQAPRLSASMVKSPNDNYQSQVFVFGGSGSPFGGNGLAGEVGLLDTDTGDWTILRPGASPGSTPYPQTRYGARMVSAIGATSPRASIQGSDIFMFGGISLDGDNNGNPLQDMWILRVFDRSLDVSRAAMVTPGESGNVHNFADAPAANSSTATPAPLSGPVIAGGEMLDQADGRNVVTALMACPVVRNPVAEHAIWMTASVMLLPIAVSILRFARPATLSQKRYLIPCTILLLASLGLAVYGIIVAYQMLGGKKTPTPFGHLRTAHSILGLVLVVIAWIVVPILAGALAMLVRAMRRRAAAIAGQDVREINFDEYSQRHLNDSGDIDDCRDDTRSSMSGGDGGGGFEVLNRPGSHRSRPSVSTAAPAVLSSPSLDRERRQSDMLGNLTALYSHVPAPDPVPTFGPNNPHPATLAALATVTRWRRAHHSFAHATLAALQILTAIALFRYLPSVGYFGGYLAYILLFYVVWTIAGWRGYPRQSLLASLLVKVGGRGHPPSRYSDDPVSLLAEDEKERRRRSTLGNIVPVGIDPVAAAAMGLGTMPLAEEADEEQIEQEMAGRDVVIMTIPRRRLTVVNA